MRVETGLHCWRRWWRRTCTWRRSGSWSWWWWWWQWWCWRERWSQTFPSTIITPMMQYSYLLQMLPAQQVPVIAPPPAHFAPPVTELPRPFLPIPHYLMWVRANLGLQHPQMFFCHSDDLNRSIVRTAYSRARARPCKINTCLHEGRCCTQRERCSCASVVAASRQRMPGAAPPHAGLWSAAVVPS